MITLIIWAKDAFFTAMLDQALRQHVPGINIIGIATTYDACRTLLNGRNGSSDILIVRLVTCDERELSDIRHIQSDSPRTRLILTADNVPTEQVHEVLRLNATGYVGGKDQRTLLPKICEAVITVSRGDPYDDPDFIPPNVLLRTISNGAPASSKLSNREKQVVLLLADHPELTYAEVAKKLVLSRHTVERYMKNVREKYHCHSKAEIISKVVPLLR